MPGATGEPVAVIGAGCRLPGGLNSPAELWGALLGARDLVTEVPASRWDALATYDPEPGVPGRTQSRWGGFLDDEAGFDFGFFGIARAEAEAADPQQRVLLEVAWEAIEHAGIAPGSLKGSLTGVFAGLSYSDYLLRHLEAGSITDPYAVLGTSHAVAAGRISYHLDLRGPAVSIDTACSSSLVAVHLACQSLRAGESDLALAGGVSVLLGPEFTISFSRMGMLSPTGRCKAFSQGADGFVRSEGCAVVVLKRLSDVTAQDRVLAVLLGSAVNQDGRSPGLAAPTVAGQAEVERRALATAGVDPARVGYIEAHGTGTPVGDPVEIAALASVYGAGTGRCAVGSVKTNIGHTEPAAGVIGLVKAALAVRSGTVPPDLHFTGWGPGVEAGGTRLFVPTEPESWPVSGRRYAAVSSYGFSGTNAHVILEEPRPVPGGAAGAGSERSGGRLFPLSASTAQALAGTADRIADWLDGDGTGISLADIGYTLARRREHRPARAVITAASRTRLASRLRSLAAGETAAGVVTGTVSGKRLGPVWVFSGQGSQWAGMGKSLLDTEPAFAAAVDALEPLVAAEAGFSLRATLAAGTLVTGIAEVQPLLFAVQVALAQTWRALGVEPAAIIGHSMGEVAAAVVAGALSLADGATVICRRSALLATLGNAGAMASVDLPAGQVAAELPAGVSIAVLSSPEMTVVSGDAEQVRRLAKRWQDRGLMARLIAADVASHSPQMDPILAELTRQLAGLRPASPQVAFYSTVDCGQVPAFDAAYWASNLRRPVRFTDAVSAALADGHRMFTEISPHPLLTLAIKQTADHAGHEVTALGSLRRDEDEQAQLLAQAGLVHCLDGTLDWARQYPGGALADVPLPAWDHHRLMIESRTWSGSHGGHPLLGTHVLLPGTDDEHLWQAVTGTKTLPWLADHQVNGLPVMPGSGYCEAALAAAAQLTGDSTAEITSVEFHEALFLAPDTMLTTTARPGAGGGWDLEMSSRSQDGELTRHATATVGSRITPGVPVAVLDPAALLIGHPDTAEPAGLYQRLRQLGISHGPSFTGVTSLHHAGPDHPTVLGRVAVPAALRAGESAFRVHPVLLDACLQTLLAHPALDGLDELMLPLGCAALRLHGDTTRGMYCLARLRETGERSVAGDIQLLAGDGTVLLELDELRIGGSDRDSAERRFSSRLWSITWEQASPPPDAGLPGRFLIITEPGAGDLADAVADSLGHRCGVLRVPLGAEGDQEMTGTIPGLLKGGDLRGVMLLAPPPRPAGRDSVEAARLGVRRLVLLAQALVTEYGGEPPRVLVVTRCAQKIAETDTVTVEQAGLRGMTRVLMSEHAELRPAYIDIDAATQADHLAAEFLADTAEDEIGWRQGTRYLARLGAAPLRDSDRKKRTARFGRDGIAVAPARRGDLDSLELTARDRVPPGPGQVEIRVHAAALNFMDVLNAMGLYKTVDGIVPALGIDCAGEVVAVGPGVDRIGPGDRVAAFSPGAMATFHTVPADRVLMVPGSMDWAQAAALPAVYVTAWHGLRQLAGLSTGERLLVHSASGGVGLAAIAIARAAGAEVYATAGTDAKRGYLRGLGVQHVMDSRSLLFAGQVRELTGGEGVDVVLNTLTGAAQRAGLDLLRPGGRFIELGKKDIYADTKIGLYPFRRNITLASVDLGLLDTARPQVVTAAIREVEAKLAAGRLPALPVTEFPLDQAATAFRTLGAGAHHGKLVLTIPQDGTREVIIAPQDVPVVRADGAYLITGGLGGLGLLLAIRLAGQGARRVVVNGRSAPSADAEQVLARLRDAGTDIVVELGDVAADSTAERLVAAATAGGLALRGIMHAAAVVPESPIGQLTDKILQRGWTAKVAGAWQLDQATDGTALDWWMNFSSGATLIGFPGLGAYSAACSWLDGFTLHQHAQGIPAVSVAWGAWSDHGLGQSFADRGYKMISVEEGLYACDRMLRHDRVLAGYIPAQDPTWLKLFGTTIHSSFLAGLGASNPYKARGTDEQAGISAELAAAVPAARPGIVTAFITGQAASILGTDPAVMDPDRQLNDAGLDSLMALELRARIEKGTSVRVPTKTLWSAGSPAELASHVLGKLGLPADVTAEHPVPAQRPAAP